MILHFFDLSISRTLDKKYGWLHNQRRNMKKTDLWHTVLIDTENEL